MGYEVDVMEVGTIEEVEEQIDASNLSEVVTAAPGSNLAGFTPGNVERSSAPMARTYTISRASTTAM